MIFTHHAIFVLYVGRIGTLASFMPQKDCGRVPAPRHRICRSGLYWCRTKIVHWTFSSTIYDEMRFKRHLLYVKDKQKLLQFIVTVSCYITLTCYANIQIRRKYHRLKSDPEQPWTLIYMRPWFWSTDFNDGLNSGLYSQCYLVISFEHLDFRLYVWKWRERVTISRCV